jgi:flagellin
MARPIQDDAAKAMRHHGKTKEKSAGRIASGEQFNKASEGAAERAAAAKLISSSRSLSAATSNARRAVAFGQTGDGSLSQLQQEIIRIKELATAASSDTFDPADREKAQAEVKKRIETIDQIVATTRFGDTVLLDGSGGDAGVFKFQVAEKAGDEVELDLSDKYDAATLGMDSADVSTYDAAQATIAACDNAIGLLNTGRAKVGAFMAGMESTITVNESKQGNIDEAVSVLIDADIAKEATNLTMAQIAYDLAQSMLTTENQSAKNVTRMTG